MVEIVKSKFRCIELNSENVRIILSLSHEELWSDVVFVNLPLCCSGQKWPLKYTHDRRTILEMDGMALLRHRMCGVTSSVMSVTSHHVYCEII